MSGLELLLGAAVLKATSMLRGGPRETTQELLRAISSADPEFETIVPLAESQLEAARALLKLSLADDLSLAWVSGPENGGKHTDLLSFIVEWYLHLAQSFGHCLCVVDEGDRALKAVALLLPPRTEEGVPQRLRATLAVGLPPIDKDIAGWGRHSARRFAAWNAARAAMHDEAVPPSSSIQAGVLPGAWAGPRQPHWRLLLLGVGDRDAAGAVVTGDEVQRMRQCNLLFRAMAAAADRDGWMCYCETTGSPSHATFRMGAIVAQFEVVRQRALECAPVEPFDVNGGLCALTRRPQQQQRLQRAVAGDGSSSMMTATDG